MAKFAPPTEEELNVFAPPAEKTSTFAPPTEEQLTKFAPPSQEEIAKFAPPEEPVKEGGALVGEEIKLSELEAIAKKHGTDVSLLKRLAPYYGASVEGQEGIAQTIGRGVGFASEALGGIPTFLA